MTKARDIASAAPAPSTVSTTELGYLDGVTSAIQTQIDGKASTTADIPKSLIDAKGDLIVGSANDTAARLAVGTNNYVLTADSAATYGIKWAAPAGGGKVLQVVGATYGTQTTSSSQTFADTGLTASITPSATSSKILVLVNQSGLQKTDESSSNAVALRLMRDSTEIVSEFAGYAGFNNTASFNYIGSASLSYLDSPSTTSSITYKTQLKNNRTGASAAVQTNGAVSTITLLEIGA